jgi:hypothetical protein
MPGGGGAIRPVVLTVIRSGSGAGMVVSAPVGITCGADCDQADPAGTTVMLSAVARLPWLGVQRLESPSR